MCYDEFVDILFYYAESNGEAEMENKSRGRKTIFNSPMVDKITVRIPQDQMIQLNRLSEKTNQPIREIVRQSLQETLKSKGQ